MRRTCASTTPGPWLPGAPTWTRTGSEAVAEVGQGTARVWRLYMAGVPGFDRNHIELHQVLSVRLAPDGTSGMPLRPDWEQPRGDGQLTDRTDRGPRARAACVGRREGGHLGVARRRPASPFRSQVTRRVSSDISGGRRSVA